MRVQRQRTCHQTLRSYGRRLLLIRVLPVVIRSTRMGIQGRIMFYVTVGLAIMFGLLIFFGLRALNEATELVFEGRLGTARTMALILERDLLHVSADVRGFGLGLIDAAERSDLEREVAGVMEHLATSDEFAFFDTDGVEVLDSVGTLLARAGAEFSSGTPRPSAALVEGFDYLTQVTVDGSGFADVVTPIGSGPEGVLVVVHLVAHNSPGPFVPANFLGTHPQSVDEADPGPGESYHLEVIDPEGNVALGIGEDERPGERSPHFDAIRERGPMVEAVALRHLVPPDSGGESHVMGVVPFPMSGFILVLEQPIDVALALPLRLRQQLLLWSGVGFVFALVLAWITTKAVVKPTHQLTLAAERIAGGDFTSPIKVTARDEVGTLAASFESMRQQISQAYEAVEVANRALESRVQERTAQLGVLFDKVISAQEEERHRLARELHDETAQTLGALAIALDRSRDSFPTESGVALNQLVAAKELVTLLLEDTRRLILDLRPMVLDDMGLIPAIRWYAESHLDDKGIEVSLEVDQPGDRFSGHIETALFRIIQEATNNVAKHSGARHARIALSTDNDVVRIVVSDDGKGFDVDGMAGRGFSDQHLGLAGMRERVGLLGGQVTIHSQTDEGTAVIVEIPLGEIVGARP